MGDQLKELCAQLDELLLQTLELSEAHIECRVKLEETMKPGFVHIAKSRYIMGNKTVSSLQLPTEDTAEFDALVTVKHEESSGDDSTLFSLQTVDSAVSSSEENNLLRKRKDKVLDAELNLNSDVIRKEKYVNPLNWFGILVPQNLKMAQSIFKSSLPLVVECANIQNRLFNLGNEYRGLIKEKMIILKQ